MLRAFGANVKDGRRADPIFIVDFYRIVTDRDDEICSIRKSFDVRAPRPADHAHPVRMILGQKSFGMHRCDERNLLSFDKPQQFLTGVAARKRQTREQQRPA